MVLAALLVTQHCSAYGEELTSGFCRRITANEHAVFSLTISRSFEPDAAFTLCHRTDLQESFLLLTVGSKAPDLAPTERQIELDQSAYSRIVSFYERALGYDVRDDTAFLDGSRWCLEATRGGTYSKACFSSPGYRSSERRLDGLYELGFQLWRIAGLESEIGELY